MSTQTRIDYFFQSNKKTTPEQKSFKMKGMNGSQGSCKKRVSANSPSDQEKKRIRLALATSPQSPLKASSSSQGLSFYPTTPVKLGNSQTSTTCSPTKSQCSPNKGQFTPKKTNRPRKYSSPRKCLNYSIDEEKTYEAIENLNQVKQGTIKANDFDLESIYETGCFEFKYGQLDTTVTENYDIKDVTVPKEKHADHLFMLVVNVFHNVINCGYFDEKEIDTIFSLFTLSAGAQILLARMLKRRRALQRIEKLQRLEDGLKKNFAELIQRQFFVSDVKDEDISTLLELLELKEIQQLGKNFKLKNESKEKLLKKLIDVAHNNKSLFPGAKPPSKHLRDKVVEMLGTCVKMPDNIERIFDRIFTLFIPLSDPSETVADMFLMLTNVEKGEVIFPELPGKRYPIFRNREHLLEYVESKNALQKIMMAIEKKAWETVRKIGHVAHERLECFLLNPYKNNGSRLPSHLQKFTPLHLWTKILFKSIDAFKKTPETFYVAEYYLTVLLQQQYFIQTCRGKWFTELALIKRKSDIDASAAVLVDALQDENLSEVDVQTLLDRVKSLLKLKNGISDNKRSLLQDILKTVKSKLPEDEWTSVTIYGSKLSGNELTKKSQWHVMRGEDKCFMTVERLAMEHYDKNGYSYGLHCEGSLPVTLFAVVFWNELYDIDVPGAFASIYQEAPYDLWTPDFFKNRRERIEDKISILMNLDLESFVETLTENFSKYKCYKTIMAGSLFNSDEQFSGLIKCLGPNGVLDICERLLDTYRLWCSGFPDLIVWNPDTSMYKIIEVKGPNDTLSPKQTLWLRYLHSKNICVELCLVKDAKKTNRAEME